MLESIVDLLGGLLLSALILLIGSSIVGSIVAALRAVGHEAAQRPLPLPSTATQRKSPFRRHPISAGLM
jgi:hypothetical protein